VLLHRPAELEAVDPAHHHVEEDEVLPVHVQGGDEAEPVGRLGHLVSLELERHLEHLARLAVVVDDDDLLARVGHQRRFSSSPRKGTVLPSSRSCSTFRSASSSFCAPARASWMPSSNAAIDSSRESPPLSRRSTTLVKRCTISS